LDANKDIRDKNSICQRTNYQQFAVKNRGIIAVFLLVFSLWLMLISLWLMVVCLWLMVAFFLIKPIIG